MAAVVQKRERERKGERERERERETGDTWHKTRNVVRRRAMLRKNRKGSRMLCHFYGALVRCTCSQAHTKGIELFCIMEHCEERRCTWPPSSLALRLCHGWLAYWTWSTTGTRSAGTAIADRPRLYRVMLVSYIPRMYSITSCILASRSTASSDSGQSGQFGPVSHTVQKKTKKTKTRRGLLLF